MGCSVIQKDLIGYHFATMTGTGREQVDAHLLGCQECLRAYLSLKREIETGGQMNEVPSAAAQKRLREAVRRSFRPGPLRRLQQVLFRPIPLYQGVMAAVLLLCVFVLVPPMFRSRPLPGGTAFEAALSGRSIDTSRQTAESLTIY